MFLRFGVDVVVFGLMVYCLVVATWGSLLFGYGCGVLLLF